MKSFKRALAVLLAVLMVAFSMPFTALAASAEDDSNVTVRMYVMDYDANKGAFGPDSNAYDGGDGELNLYDPTAVTISEAGSTKSMVAVAFFLENAGNADVTSLTFNFDTDLAIPGYYRSKTAVTTGSAAGTNVFLAGADTYDSSLSTAGNVYPFLDSDARIQLTLFANGSAYNETTNLSEDYDGWEFDGQLVGIIGVQLQDETVDLTQAITFDTFTGYTFVNYGGGDDDAWFAPGATNEDGTPATLVKNLVFATPQWSGEEPQPSTDVTYTFIDGTSTTVAADADAPANTPATDWAFYANGTHKHTVYNWVKDSDTAYHEAGEDEIGFCDSNTIVTPAQEYIHTADTLQDGITAVTCCSVCGGNQQGGEVTVAQHTYTDVVTAPTCSAQGYTTHTCDCGASYVDTYTSINPNNHVNTTNVDAVAATCIAGGYTAGVFCNDCQTWVSGHEATGVDLNNHAEGCELVTDDAVAPTCITDGKTEGSHYSLCGTVVVAQDNIPASEAYHDWQVESSTNATCKTPGTVNYRCSICGNTKQETGVLDPTNHEGTLVTDEAVAATCVATGLTAGSHWSCCDAVEVAQETVEIDANNHAGTVALDESTVVVATCTQGGYTGDAKCSACGNVVTAGNTTEIDPENHTGSIVTDEAVAPTRATTGLTEGSHYDCCGAVVVAQEVIPALGVDITINGSDLGTVTVNGTVAGTEAVNVPYGESYTLVATPAVDGATFAGWMIGDKIVSTAAEYTTAAFADTTYTAVFEEEDADEFTVTFVDKFNNVIATYSSTDVAAWTEIPEIASPFAGYTISGYDMTLEQIQAATGAITVKASYEKAEQTFTVNATGATITVDGVDYAETATVTGYDVPVTVTADNATVWYVNGKEVGFGESYTFYVTSDVTVTFDTAAVEAAPVVTAVNGNGDLQADGTKVRFLASRNVPTSYKVVESGFVYGKEMSSDDLVLENVGKTAGTANATVKLYKNTNTANEGQFALNYGVSAHTVASARAYLIVSLNGVVQAPIYADAQIYNY